MTKMRRQSRSAATTHGHEKPVLKSFPDERAVIPGRRLDRDLGLVFLVSVWFDRATPTFGTNFLTLMGISSGTYLAFKIPEQRAQCSVSL
jgi:hypothetical protein